MNNDPTLSLQQAAPECTVILYDAIGSIVWRNIWPAGTNTYRSIC